MSERIGAVGRLSRLGIAAAICFAAALSVASVGYAQGKPDMQTRQEARKFIEASRMADAMKAVIPAAQESVMGLLLRTNPAMAEQIRPAVEELIMPEFYARLPELVDAAVDLYALHFNAEELRKLTAFYETDEGRKLALLTPTLTLQGRQLGQAWGQRVAIDAMAKAAPKLRERGIKNL